MRLIDLEPKLNGDMLHFWCPKCDTDLKGDGHITEYGKDEEDALIQFRTKNPLFRVKSIEEQ
jgi:hypothetical protein